MTLRDRPNRILDRSTLRSALRPLCSNIDGWLDGLEEDGDFNRNERQHRGKYIAENKPIREFTVKQEIAPAVSLK
jgi:hypothetical protein